MKVSFQDDIAEAAAHAREQLEQFEARLARPFEGYAPKRQSQPPLTKGQVQDRAFAEALRLQRWTQKFQQDMRDYWHAMSEVVPLKR